MRIPYLLFTHNDLDGAGCAVVFKSLMQALNKDCVVIHCSNNNLDSQVEKAWNDGLLDRIDTIMFGDICPSESLLKRLNENYPYIQIFDHHDTNMYASKISHNFIIKSEKNSEGKLESGTSLMFQCLVKELNISSLFNYELFSDFVENVRSYDTYEWKKTNNTSAYRLSILFNILGIERFVNKYVYRILDTSKNKYLRYMTINLDDKYPGLIELQDNEYIDAKLDQEQKFIDSITMNNVKIVTIKDLKAAVMFSEGSINELSNQFLTKYSDVDIFITISLGSGTCSFRCINEDFKLGETLAKPLGGGGHPCAAGIPIPVEIKDEIFKLIINHISNG